MNRTRKLPQLDDFVLSEILDDTYYINYFTYMYLGQENFEEIAELNAGSKTLPYADEIADLIGRKEMECELLLRNKAGKKELLLALLTHHLKSELGSKRIPRPSTLNKWLSENPKLLKERVEAYVQKKR